MNNKQFLCSSCMSLHYKQKSIYVGMFKYKIGKHTETKRVCYQCSKFITKHKISLNKLYNILGTNYKSISYESWLKLSYEKQKYYVQLCMLKNVWK